jgi:hypothetical protein
MKAFCAFYKVSPLQAQKNRKRSVPSRAPSWLAAPKRRIGDGEDQDPIRGFWVRNSKERIMMTFCTKDDIQHIDQRHGPQGSATDRFDNSFLVKWGNYAKVIQAVGDGGVSAPEYDNSGRLIYRFYRNFNEKTGIGVDQYGAAVTFKGVETVGTIGNLLYHVETAFPKGILKGV